MKIIIIILPAYNKKNNISSNTLIGCYDTGSQI